MSKPKTRYPIESFGPEIMAALIRGGHTSVRIPMLYRTAVSFRRRIHQLRGRMKEENHPQYSIAAKAKVQIKWPPNTPLTRQRNGLAHPTDSNTPCEVVLSPHDSEFTEALRGVGIETDLKSDPLSTTPVDTSDPLADFRPSNRTV